MASDLDRLLRAVAEMRKAQKVEWAALPSNARVWKRAREQQTVAQLERNVDALVEELRGGNGNTTTGRNPEDCATAGDGRTTAPRRDDTAR